MTRRVLHLQLAAVGVALILAAILGGVGSAQTPRPVAIDADDIGGVVTGPKDRRPACGSSPKRPTCPHA